MSGLLDDTWRWLSKPVAMDSDAGINNLGLIGATLKDVGAQLNGDEATALPRFQNQLRRIRDPQDDDEQSSMRMRRPGNHARVDPGLLTPRLRVPPWTYRG